MMQTARFTAAAGCLALIGALVAAAAFTRTGAADLAFAALSAAGILLAALASWLTARRRTPVAAAGSDDPASSVRALRALTDASPDAIFARDLQGRYLVINRAAAALLGIDAAAALGRRSGELLAAQSAARIEAVDHEIVESGETSTFEEQIDTPHGRRAYLTTNGPLRDASGRVTGVYGISRDITCVHPPRDEQSALLGTALDQSTVAVIITDLDANVVYANAAALASTGCTRDELIGRNCRTLESKRVHSPADGCAGLWNALARGAGWRGVIAGRSTDARESLEDVVVTPLRTRDGRVTHYLGVMKDVTEQRRLADELERQRMQLEEAVAQRTAELELARRGAEEANRAKSDFLATMGHEIRTPMNGVVGLADVLARSGLTAYQADLLRTMRESSLGLLALIDDLLDISKIEAGRLELEPTPLALRALVERSCESLQPLAAQRNVMLHVFVDPALPEQVRLDGVRWRQILTNLVSNAIKFSAGLERPGRVRVRVAANADGALELSVADNGIGMRAEALERIFQPFVQAERSTTRRYGGTGLGLSIVRRLAQAFGGHVQVQSTPGVGSRFTVSVPLEACRASDAAASDAACASRVDLTGVNCHVCADDIELGHDWAAYLSAAGAAVHNWDDPERLLQAIEHEAHAERVAVVGAEWSDGLANELRTAAQLTGTGLVLIGRGQRRTPRRGHGGEIGLDADVLQRDALLQAVLLATGSEVAAPSPECAAGTPVELEKLARGHCVLVAEDDLVNQEVIVRQLALLGVQAHVVDDGEQALAEWRSGSYALLLSDLHMPGLDGYELVKRIRADERQRQGGAGGAGEQARFPVIALSATVHEDDVQRCRDAGMDDCLSKPVALEQLAAALHRWFAAMPPAAATTQAPAAGAGAARQTDGPSPERRGEADALPAVYDPDRLSELAGSSRAVRDQIGRAFAQAARLGVDELGQALRERRFEDAGALAQRLHLAAGAIGAQALAEACAAVEQAAVGADGVLLDATAARLEGALAQLVPALAPEARGEAASTVAATPAIYVVDDDPFQRELLRVQLDGLLNVPVTGLASPTAALETAARADSTRLLLLVALQMSGMDGIELMRLLAARGYQGALALTGSADERLLHSAVRLAREHRLHVIGYLKKPVAADDLRALVQGWQRALPPVRREAGARYDIAALRGALQHHELVLHFQPQLRLSDGTMAGVEALVRWQHPRDGLVMPDRFIGVAEEGGLIGDLTDRVLMLAMAQMQHWRHVGLALRVAVNVSMDNLVQLDFPERVLALLAEHSLAPGDLMLEVTESRLMSDPRSALDILARLRLNGVALAIDDFGTGHSSLAQLRDLPFDEVKFDRSFVRGCGANAAQRAIVGAAIGMAHELGLHSVAEGVENFADWEAVRSAGCDVAQGYFIARPMPGERLAAWVAGIPRRFGVVRHTAAFAALAPSAAQTLVTATVTSPGALTH